MKNLIFLFIILFTLPCSSQSSWIESDISRESDANTPKDVLPIINEQTKELALFYRARRVIFAKLYNNEQKLISSINAINLPKKTKILIGATYDSDYYTLFFCNSKKTLFSSVTVNIKTKRFSTKKDLGIKFKDEKVVEFLIDDNTINILTVSKNKSLFKTYSLKNENSILIKTFEFSQNLIKSNKDLEYNLFELIFGNPSYSSVEIIDNELPNSLEKSAAFTKIYYKKGKLVLTNNLFNKYTYIFNIDIFKDTSNLSVYENSDYTTEDVSSNSNSYIFENNLYYVYSKSDNLSFDIYNLDDKSLIKQFQINREESITFKNTPIIQEGGELDKYRELEKTSKFLRKITNSKIGVSVFKKENDIIITIGASEEINNSAMIGLGAGGAIGGLISGIIFSAYDSYSRTKSTRIECLFNSEFEHKIGEIPLNKFNEIDKFKTIYNLENSKLQTVFKYNDDFVLGALDKDTNIFKLYKFE